MLTYVKILKKRGKEYVAVPSSFISGKGSIFYAENIKTSLAECDFIIDSQLSDGSFNVTFEWFTNYKESAIATNW